MYTRAANIKLTCTSREQIKRIADKAATVTATYQITIESWPALSGLNKRARARPSTSIYNVIYHVMRASSGNSAGPIFLLIFRSGN